MRETADFGQISWLSGTGPPADNGRAVLSVTSEGPDLRLLAEVGGRSLVATSVPDWPGWRAHVDGKRVETFPVNHAFVGFWLAAGKHEVRLTYRPISFDVGLLLLCVGIAVSAAAVLARRRGRGVSAGTRAPAAS
jgi:hypothetical protein